jgi:hypothetical protein
MTSCQKPKEKAFLHDHFSLERMFFFSLGGAGGGKDLLSYLACIWLNLLLLDHNTHFGYITKLTKTENKKTAIFSLHS